MFQHCIGSALQGLVPKYYTSTRASYVDTCIIRQHVHHNSTRASYVDTCIIRRHVHCASARALHIDTCTVSWHVHYTSTRALYVGTCTCLFVPWKHSFHESNRRVLCFHFFPRQRKLRFSVSIRRQDVFSLSSPPKYGHAVPPTRQHSAQTRFLAISRFLKASLLSKLKAGRPQV